MKPTSPAGIWHTFPMFLLIVPFWLFAHDDGTLEENAGTAIDNFPGWNRKQAITIDHTKVGGGSDLLDYPFLVTLDHLNAEIVDGGANSALNGGGDLRFSSDAAGNTRLAIEVVEFVTSATPANRRCQVWVKIPVLSASTDTTIYVWYDKAGESQPIAINPYGSRAVWDNYYFVSHDGLYDSATGQSLTVAGSPTVGTTPYGGRSWKGNGTTDFTYMADGGIDLSGDLSVSIWKKNTTFPVNLGVSMALFNSSGWLTIRSHGSSEAQAASTFFGTDISGASQTEGGRFYPVGDQFGWHHFSMTQTTPVGEGELVRGDGTPTTLSPTSSYSWGRPMTSGYITIGNSSPDSSSWLGGELAELRISETVISPGFSDTDYNNMRSPESFAYAGTPENSGQTGGSGTGGYWSRTGDDIHYTDGNVGIGTSEPGIYKLAVNGKIHSKEVKVDMSGWADYVFEDDYDLPTLEEVERHIKEKGHLADVPSAEDVIENGIELGEMDRILLRKIEELTLYILQEKAERKEQEVIIYQLKKRISILENNPRINNKYFER